MGEPIEVGNEEQPKPKTADRHQLQYLDEPDGVGPWLVRLLKGTLVGIGAILPGLSGGVLAVIFRIYDPLIRFLANIRRRFVKQVLYFLPIVLGVGLGILLFSIVVAAAFESYAAQFTCLFIGFVIGTFPSLYRTAGVQGRKPVHWVVLAVSAAVIFTLMVVGGQSLVHVPPSIPVWFGSGALIGLGVIVPGMSPSNFLIYFGLYDKMAEGIRDFDMTVAIPLALGVMACVLALAKVAEWAFDKYYAGMYHFILGMVVGSSLAIFPTVVFPAYSRARLEEVGLSMSGAIIFAIAMLVVGVIASYLFSLLEDKVRPAGGHPNETPNTSVVEDAGSLSEENSGAAYSASSRPVTLSEETPSEVAVAGRVSEVTPEPAADAETETGEARE